MPPTSHCPEADGAGGQGSLQGANRRSDAHARCSPPCLHWLRPASADSVGTAARAPSRPCALQTAPGLVAPQTRPEMPRGDLFQDFRGHSAHSGASWDSSGFGVDPGTAFSPHSPLRVCHLSGTPREQASVCHWLPTDLSLRGPDGRRCRFGEPGPGWGTGCLTDHPRPSPAWGSNMMEGVGNDRVALARGDWPDLFCLGPKEVGTSWMQGLGAGVRGQAASPAPSHLTSGYWAHTLPGVHLTCTVRN